MLTTCCSVAAVLAQPRQPEETSPTPAALAALTQTASRPSRFLVRTPQRDLHMLSIPSPVWAAQMARFFGEDPLMIHDGAYSDCTAISSSDEITEFKRLLSMSLSSL